MQKFENTLIDPTDGKIDLNRIKGVKRFLVVPVLLLLGVMALSLVFSALGYIAAPTARFLDLDILHLNTAIILAIGFLMVQILLLFPFEAFAWIQARLQDKDASPPLARVFKPTFWKGYLQILPLIVANSILIKECLYLYFGRPETVVKNDEVYFIPQGGLLEIVLYIFGLIISSVLMVVLIRNIKKQKS